MSKFLLNRLSKDELVDLVLTQEARHEELMKDFQYKWDAWARQESQASYSSAYSSVYAKKMDHLIRSMRDIANALNQDEDVVDDTTVLDEISSIVEDACLFTIKDGKYQSGPRDNYHPHFVDIGKRYFDEHEAKYNSEDGLKNHWKKLWAEKVDKYENYEKD